ncbi:tripartite tricarboxylate transporter substrate binding protein [Pigmentiphaga daeguensis]|jgi:tripartite-type tricarboxylate transporter receptor subunit TctC|uniref:Tripartite tricarboxylate transporter substrate binding protein BugE n=1 Tax=Pigmentiphaga daeguensis TaxID=414049 RepID=A0ABN1BT79_9BURK
MNRSALLRCGLLIALAPHCAAYAQDPFTIDRPVRLIVPFAAGNTLDSSARVVAEAFLRITGQPLIVDNKPGGAGSIAAHLGASAAPDGYTVLMASSGMLAINPHAFSRLNYDPVNDFKAVTGFVGSPMVMAVNKNVPADNLQGFIDWTLKNPGKVSYASFTAGNPSHFAGMILNKRTGMDMAHVPYNGTSPAVQNLIGEQIQAAFVNSLAVAPYLAEGRVKILATTSPKRRPNLPNVPTFTELGYPELEILLWTTLMVPCNTPEAPVRALHAAFVKALADKEVESKLNNMDFVTMPSTPEETTRFIASESARWKEAVRLSGFKATE